jgi:hypothetical protein
MICKFVPRDATIQSLLLVVVVIDVLYVMFANCNLSGYLAFAMR